MPRADIGGAASTADLASFNANTDWEALAEHLAATSDARPFTIALDYRFADPAFFTDEVKAALEFAAHIWEALILDEFEDVPAGVTFSIDNPSSPDFDPVEIELEDGIDDLLIFVGSYDFGPNDSAIGRGGPAAFDFIGDSLIRSIFPFRDLGAPADFEPWAGNMFFDEAANWDFSINARELTAIDFLSVALHEIGHVLGFGASSTYDAFIKEGGFIGSNATASNGGESIPADTSHFQEGFAGNITLMDPITSFAQRLLPSIFDLAVLADIGYEIVDLATVPFEVAGYDGQVLKAQGETFPLATPNAETIVGTVVDDVLDGLGGDDLIFGEEGVDILFGGQGDDQLVGGPGGDRLIGDDGNDDLFDDEGQNVFYGGPGIDFMRGGSGLDVFQFRPGDGGDANDTPELGGIFDFQSGFDVIEIDVGFGFESIEAFMDTAIQDSPFSNTARIVFDDETFVDVINVTSFQPRDFRIGTVGTPPRPEMDDGEPEPEPEPETGPGPDPTPTTLDALAVSLFDSAFYLGRGGNADLRAAGVADPLQAFAHWFEGGFAEAREYAPLLTVEALFDEEAYLTANPEVRAAIDDGFYTSALDHYVQVGSALDAPNGEFGAQFNPNDFFDPAAYRAANPDIVAAVDFNGNPIDPFVHYLQFGEREILADLRTLDGLVGFDPRFYRTANPDVAAFIDAGIDGNLGLITFFQHFVDFGVEEGRAGLSETPSVLIAEPTGLI